LLPGVLPAAYVGGTMRKTKKKLVLAKETVRSLQVAVLGQVTGASDDPFYCTTDTFYNSCRRFCQQEPGTQPYSADC
jgi:hypothetical protein